MANHDVTGIETGNLLRKNAWQGAAFQHFIHNETLLQGEAGEQYKREHKGKYEEGKIPQEVLLSKEGLHAVEEKYYQTIPSIAPDVVDFASRGAKVAVAAGKRAFLDVKPKTQFEIDTYQQKFLPVVGKLLNSVIAPTQLKLSQSGQELLMQTRMQDKFIRYATNYNYGVHGNIQTQKRVAEKIRKDGRYIEFDLEGMGKNITEFAFLDFAENGTDKPDIKKTAYGLIGIEDDDLGIYQDMAARYKKFGLAGAGKVGVSDDDLYILRALAKRGHKNTQTKLVDGMNVLTSYATDKDVYIPDNEDIARGIKLFNQDWHTIHDAGPQEYDGAKFGLSNSKVKLYAHEAKILDMLYHAKKNDIALSGLNVFEYDNKQIDNYFNSSKGDARLVYRSITGGSLESAFNIMDTTMVHRAMNSHEELLKDSKFMNFLALNPNETPNTSKGLQYRHGKGKNYAHLLEEAFKWMGYTQHGGLSDSGSQGYNFHDMLKTIYNPDSKDYIFKGAGEEFETKIGDIFQIDKGVFKNSTSSGLSFTVDGITGAISFDGLRFDGTGQRHQTELAPQGLKSGSYAALLGIKEVTPSSEVVEAMGKINGGSAAHDKYVAMAWAQYGEAYAGDEHGQAKNIHFWIGSEREAQEFLGNQKYIGSLPEEAVRQIVSREKSKEKILDAVSGHYDDKVQVAAGSKENREALRGNFKESLKAANQIKQQDSASRWLREMTYNKAVKSLAYVEYVHNEAIKNAQAALGLNPDHTLSAVEMHKQATAILNDASVNVDTRKKLFSIFGNKGYQPMVQTIANAVNSTGYLYSVQEVMKYAVEEAKKAAAPYKTDKKNYNAVLNGYFEAIYNNTLASIASQVNDINPAFAFSAEEAYGQKLDPLALNGKQKRSFSIDVTNLVRPSKRTSKATLTTPSRTIFTFDPDELHWDKRLAKTIGYDNSTAAVQALADTISSDYGFTKELKHLGKEVKSRNYTAVEGMALVGEAIKHLRKNYSRYGSPEGTYFLDTVNGPAPVWVAKKLGKLDDMIQNSGGTELVNRFEGKKTGAELSQEITEILFRSTESISVADLVARGYTESEAKQIIEVRARRKGSTARYLSTFLTPILDKNKFITYSLDTESGALKLSNGQSSVDMTRYLPYDRYDANKGRFYTQLGGMQIATTKSFGPNTELGGFSVNNVIDAMADKMADFAPGINGRRKSEIERIELLSWMLGETAKDARMSGVTRFDQQDRRMGRALDLMPFFKRVGHYAANGAYEAAGLKEQTIETLTKLGNVERLEGFDTKNIKTDEIEILMKDLDALLAPLSDKDSKLSQLVFNSSASAAEAEYFREKILPNINRQGNKHPEKGIVYLTGTDLTTLGGFGEDNRHMDTVLTRSKEMTADSFIRNNAAYDEIISRGSMLYTDDGGEDFKSVIRGQKVTINTQTIDKIIAQRIKEEHEGKADKLVTALKHRQALFQYANENSSFMDPRLQDALVKNIVQRENTKDLMDMTLLQNAVTEDQLMQEAQRREKTMEVVTLTEKGVKFNYGDWDYVKAGDIIGWNESFEHTASKLPADREGYLTKRYFRDNREYSAEEIEQYLNSDKEKRKEIAQAIGRASGAERDAIARQAVASILTRDKFQLKYTVESPEYIGAQKMADSAEKGEASFPTAALGAEDERIRNVVGEGNGPLRPTAAVLGDERKLNTFLQAHGYEGITDEALTRGGFKNYEEFRQAALKEQSTYFDTIKTVFRDAGFLGKDDNPIAFGNVTSEAAKGSHMEMEQVQGMLASAFAAKKQEHINSGKTSQEATEEARKELHEELRNNNVFLDKNGNNILKDLEDGKDGFALEKDSLYNINMDALRDVVKKSGGMGEFRQGTGDYKDIGAVHVSQGSYHQLSDADEVGLYRHGNEKGIKITRRMLQSLDQEEAGAVVLDRMRSTYENLIKGHLAENPKDQFFVDSIIDKFNDRYEDQGAKVSWDGKNLNMTYAPKERRIHAGRDGISENLREEIIRGDASSAVWAKGVRTDNVAVNGHFTARTMDELQGYGISGKTVRNILEQYADDGHYVVGKENFLNTYSYISSRVASKFNQIAQNGTEDEVQAHIDKLIKGGDFGSKVVGLEELNMDSRYSTNNPLNPMRRNMIVDFGLNGEHDYIALPFQNLSVMDSSKNQEGVVARNELASAVRSAQFWAGRAIEGNEQEKKNALEKYQGALDTIREKANALVHTKYGTGADATSGYWTGSGTFKAQTIRLTNDEFQVKDKDGILHSVNPIMESAKIDGMSLGEHIKAGHKVNAVFLGRDFFENAIMDDGFQKIQDLLGADLGKDMFKNINSTGAVGAELRQPLEYNTSIGGAYIFYDETLGRNQARVAQWTLTGQNGDTDGDLVYAALARNDATIRYTDKDGNQQIINARLNQLQAELLGRRGLQVSWNDGGKVFRNYEKSAEVLGTVALSGIDDAGLEGLHNIENDIKKTFELHTEEIGGHIYNPGRLSLQERQDMHDEFVHKVANSDGFAKVIGEYNEAEGKNVTVETMSHEDLSKVGNMYIDAAKSAGQGDFAREAEVIASEVNQRALDSEIAKTMGRTRAGLINMHTHRLTGIMNMLKSKGLDNGMDEGDIEIVGNMMAHLKEAGQAPKNAQATYDEMAGVGNAIEKFFGVRKRWDDDASQYVYSNGARNKQPLYDIISKLYDDAGDKGIKELNKLPEYVETNGGRVSKERVLQAFEHMMGDNQTLDYRVFNAFSQGYSKKVLEDDNYQPDAEDALHKLQEKTGAYADMIGFEEAKFNEIENPVINVGFESADAPQYSDDENKFVGRAVEDAGPSLRDDIRGTFKSMKSAFHGHGAMAMLGFAGATMMAGLMGGAPTSAQPTDMQAKGIQQENAMYEIPSTMPAGVGGSSAHQSYIININASTSRGRDFATAAINQAMQRVPQQNGGNTMTMNIKDSSSNIGYSDIANYISNML